MEISTKNLQPVIAHEKVETELFGVVLSETQRIDRSFGRPVFLENMNINGEVKDGKIQLVQDKLGNLSNKIDFKRPELEIPKELLGKKLTQEEQENLSTGKPVSFNVNGKNYQIQVDNDLNKVVIRSEREIESLPKIGGYNLSEKEQNALFKGERLSPKVYESEKGSFIANVELSPDKKGLVFTNIKPVSNEQVPAMKEKYNKPEEKTDFTKDTREVAINKDLKINAPIEVKTTNESKISGSQSIKPSTPKIGPQLGL